MTDTGPHLAAEDTGPHLAVGDTGPHLAVGPCVAAGDAAAVPEIAPGARALLRLMVEVQERERRYLGDVFHDGPIQDFTAIMLSAASVRRTLASAAAERIAGLETQLRDTIAALPLPPPAFRVGRAAPVILATALASRVLGPFTQALDTELAVDDPAPSRDEIAELLGVVQLLLLEADPLRPAAHVTISARTTTDGLTLALGAAPDPRSVAEAAADPPVASARTERFTRVAALTGARITEHTPAGPWHATLRWPRQPAAAR